MSDFKRFYNKSRNDRIGILYKNKMISKTSYEYLISSKILSNDIAGQMVENQLSVYGVPFAVATNFLINGKEYIIPMAIEEPSVVAAASNAAKIMANSGGIITSMDKRYMIGQIAYYNIKDFEKEALMKKIAFVFQNAKLFKTSIFENVKMGNKNASDEIVGGVQFGIVAKAKDGEILNLKAKDFSVSAKFRLDPALKGTVALLGAKNFDGYAFKQVVVSK